MLRRLVLPVLAFFIAVLLALWLLPLKSLIRGGNTVLVIYDEPEPSDVDRDRLDALMLRQLLGHFETAQIDMTSTGEYKEGDAKKFDVVFYVGTKPEVPLPTYLLDDLFFRKGTVVWINANLNQMADRHNLESYGIQTVDDSESHATNRVEYKGKSLWKLDTRTYAVKVVNEQQNQVLAWAVGVPGAAPPSGHAEMYGPDITFAGQELAPVAPSPEYSPLPPLDEKLSFGITPEPTPEPAKPLGVQQADRLPWIVRGEKFWYVSSNPFSYHVEGGAYLAFCDVLHDIMGSGVTEQTPRGFVRLEDVHAARDGADLIAAADYLQSKNVPFGFTLVPAYINPETDTTRYLSNTPEFKDVVRGLIARGGVPILHGYTHQSQGETAVDYEFWNVRADAPLGLGPEFASERVLRSLSECFLADVYPVAWTTPHYAAGQIDYEAFRNYFTTVIERRQPIDRLGSDQYFPYVIYHDMHQQIVLPENLGYVQPAAGRTPEAILKDADNSLVVRDGWGSFFFHTFLELDLLKQIVEGMDSLGYEWVALTELNSKVRTEDTNVLTGVGEVKLSLNSQYLHSFTLDKGEQTDETYSFRPVTGQIDLFASAHEGEIKVYQGVYTAPPLTLANIGMFRPTVSGLTSPVAIFLLFVGLVILFVFLVIWIFLLTRKATNEMKSALQQRRKG